MSEKYEAWTEEDYRNFQGMTPEDFFEWHESEQIKGPRDTIYKSWGELLKYWQTWCEKQGFSPVTDFREQIRLFVEAEDKAGNKAGEVVLGHIPASELKTFTEDKKQELFWKLHEETERQTKEVLQEQGYITLFDHFTTTVNPETLEPEAQHLFKKPSQRNVPVYAKAIYRLSSKSSVTWQDFYDHYVALLTAEGAERSNEFAVTETPVMSTTLAVATHPYIGVMRRSLLSKKESKSEQINVRENGKRKVRSVVSSLAMPDGIQPTNTPEGYLEELTQALLKQRDTSLLKVHLDLTNQAYCVENDRPVFRYDIIQAAHRLGASVQSHGAFDTNTLRAIYKRILALNFHRIDVYEIKEKRRGSLVMRSPFWIIKGEIYAKAGDVVDGSNLPLLLTDENSPIIKSLVLEPGEWWQAAGMRSHGYHLHIPSSLLQLPTDSRSETNHIAIKLAAELAVWERTNQKGLPSITRQIGALLDRAAVTSYDEMKAKHPEQQKRLRRYLIGDDGCSGAFGLLREHGAFDIDIKDEGAFWASGQNWFNKFWESTVCIQVRPYKRTKKLAN